MIIEKNMTGSPCDTPLLDYRTAFVRKKKNENLKHETDNDNVLRSMQKYTSNYIDNLYNA